MLYEIQEDPEVLNPMENNPEAFIYGSKEQKNDKELAMKAVSHDGMLLDYVEYKMKNDVDVIKTAINKIHEQ